APPGKHPGTRPRPPPDRRMGAAGGTGVARAVPDGRATSAETLGYYQPVAGGERGCAPPRVHGSGMAWRVRLESAVEVRDAAGAAGGSRVQRGSGIRAAAGRQTTGPGL